MFCNVIVRNPGDADAGQRCIDHEIGIAKRHWTVDIDFDTRTATFEIPVIERAAEEPETDASMLLQILRRFRDVMVRQIVGRRHRGKPHVRPEPNSNHVAWHILQESYAGIETVGHDIYESRIHHDLNMYIRIHGEEVGKNMADERPSACLRCADPYRARGTVA